MSKSEALRKVCDERLFIDVGANRGDSLAKFFTQPNCYESCEETQVLPNGLKCLPASQTCGYDPARGGTWHGDCPSANLTCFCHQKARRSECGWEWPFWLTLSTRRTYCAEAFEANPLLTHELKKQAHRLVSRGFSPHIRVYNGTAWSRNEGFAQFGIDVNHTIGSSLILSKRTLGPNGKVNGGPPVGDNQVTVRTVNAVSWLRSRTAKTIALKIDVEGSEFTMLRELIGSGVLCDRVEDLWIEWHQGRVNHREIGLPMKAEYVRALFTWMFTTFGSIGDGRVTLPSQRSPHCRVVLGNWA